MTGLPWLPPRQAGPEFLWSADDARVATREDAPPALTLDELLTQLSGQTVDA